MKVAIMQPYFFPYIGYFQLLNAVDIFVVYDDVNFIKQSWITRNNILLNDKAFRINLIVEGASSFKKINEINRRIESRKWLKTIEQGYSSAPFFSEVYPLIEKISMSNEQNLSNFLQFQLEQIAKYLNIKTRVKKSSEIEKNCSLKGQDKVIAICKALKTTNYLNAIGGKELYKKEDFRANKIILNFVRSNTINYKQKNDYFVPNLSIIDVLMFNEVDKVKDFLNNYELI